MNDDDLLRYSRQIMLPQIDFEGQQAIVDSTVLLIGLGGLGSPSSLYLAAAGIGHLVIADFDKVEISNLQRQIIHYTDDIGNYKVDSAKDKLLSINPNLKITTVKNLNEENLSELVNIADIVLDGTDNFKTRFSINKACVNNKVPLVSAAVIRFEGQLSVFKGYESNKPCYQCLYPNTDEQNENCVDNGILAPVAGFVGSLQALQAIKVILNLGEQLDSSLMLIDVLDLSFRAIKIQKDPHCQTCK